MRQKSIQIPNTHHDAPIPMASRVGPILATSAISGQGADGKLPPDIDGQCKNTFENLKATLAVGGLDLGDVVHVAVTVTIDSNRSAVNKYWLECWPDDAHRPARHTGVGEIRGGRLIQIEALAVAKTWS